MLNKLRVFSFKRFCELVNTRQIIVYLKRDLKKYVPYRTYLFTVTKARHYIHNLLILKTANKM